MKILFPVFLCDKDGYIYKIPSSKKVDWLEKIDIEDNEYKAWDSKGKIVDLFIENEKIKTKLAKNSFSIATRKKMALDFANKVRPFKEIEGFSSKTSVNELLDLAIAHVGGRKTIQEILKGIFYRRPKNNFERDGKF